MNTSDRKEEEDYEVGDRFSLPLDNEDYDNKELNNNELNNNELNNNELNNNELNNNELANNELANNNLNNVTAPNMNTSENETTGSEIALLGDDVERYKDDDAFLQDTLMPIMRSYFPTDPSENGEKNILMGVLKHDAIVIVKVKQLMESGTNNNEDFVEIIEEYTDDEYMDKETIEDTLELTLKYVTGLKSSIDSYVEYDFFCSSIPGYKQFVEEMLQYRVVMRLNRHMFYKELYGYLRKEVFDNYDFNTAIFDFDSEVNEFVKENKRQGRNNNKKPTANKKPTVNNYEEVPTGIINANKINTSRVGSSIFGTANATVGTANSTVNTANATAGTANATVGTANSTVNTANTTVGTANSTVNTANTTEKSTATPTLMNQITAAITPATAPATAPATPPPTLLNQIATATGLRAPQKGGRITPRQGHNSSRFTRRH
jgi:hypothetical protein